VGAELVAPVRSGEDRTRGGEANPRFDRKGATAIGQGLLIHDNWVGSPDLMLRREGASEFGDWHYEPHDTKAGNAKKRVIPLPRSCPSRHFTVPCYSSSSREVRPPVSPSTAR